MWQWRRQTYKMRRKPWTLSIVLSQRVCYYYNTVKCYFTTFKNCPIMWENRHMQTCAKLPFPHFSVCRCMRGRYLLNIFSYGYLLLDIQSIKPMRNRRYLCIQLFQIYTICGHLCKKCILDGFWMLQNRTYSLQNTYPHLFANGYHAKIRIQTSAFLVKNRIPQRRLYRYFIIRMFSRECAAIQKISKRI